MTTVYGSLKCPYCVVLKENLDRNNAPYEFIDILESLRNDIGLPALVDDNGKVWTDWESWLTENGYEIFIPEASLTSGQACSLDRKGC